MKFVIHEGGYKAIASMVAGAAVKIDTIKVAMDPAPDVNVPVGSNDSASVPAQGSTSGATARFTGLVRSQDFSQWRPGRRITKATVYAGSVPVATSLILPAVEVASGAYVTVSVDLAFGD